MFGQECGRAINLCADARGQRHLGDGNEQATVGNIVHRGHECLVDQAAHKIACAPLGHQIDRRGRPLLASADFAQIERLADPAPCLAKEHDQLVGSLEGNACRLREIIDQTDAADGGRRQDRAAVGLVVKRHIAGYDREFERLAGGRDPLNAADKLAHDLRPLGISEVQIIGHRHGLGADG